jgi:hypothetical protein
MDHGKIPKPLLPGMHGGYIACPPPRLLVFPKLSLSSTPYFGDTTNRMGISLKKPEGVPGKSWPAIMIGMFVAFGGVLFGYDTGTISGIIAMPYVFLSFIQDYL